MEQFQRRRQRLHRRIQKSDADVLLVTDSNNVMYLTGFTGGDSILLASPENEVLLSDSRFTTQIPQECPGLDMAIHGTGVPMVDHVASTVKKAKIKRLGIEADSMTVSFLEQLREKLPKVEMVLTRGLVEDLRAVKDRDEIERLRSAVRSAERAFAVIRASLRAGQTEREVAHELEHQIRLFGGDGCSFPPIVAVGPRSALPHARPTGAKIGESDFVLIDWGAASEYYRSDLTRVLVTGKISPKFERIYKVVLNASEKAIAAIRPGAMTDQVDAVARRVIARAGHGKHFGHSLGHGIGLNIHEAPRLATTRPVELKAGMVVTVEPGIYLPGWGGIRLEDDVLVTRNGHEVLTSVPKGLADCIVD